MTTLIIIIVCAVWLMYNTYQLAIGIRNGMFSDEEDMKGATVFGIFVSLVVIVILGPIIINTIGKKQTEEKAK